MKILILPGDGIGPEIMAATMTALKALNDTHALKLDFEEHAVGFAALEAEGSTLSGDLLDRIRAAEGTILGPCDTCAYPPVEEGGVNPSAAIRKELDLFANIRPSRSRKGVPSAAAGMDLVMARENTEGF